jgi:hypothetical protein
MRMPPSMTRVAAAARVLGGSPIYNSSDGSTYPRLQILTIKQILDGRQPEYPLHRRDATFKRLRAAAPKPPPT